MELIDQLEQISPLIFIAKNEIRNEQGLPIEFHDRPFLKEIYKDLSPYQVILKAPQIGMTTLMLIKSFWVAHNLRKDIIYTLPTQADVSDMAGGKINRIIAQNPVFMGWVADHDSVESKRVGDQTIYYRGTFTTKQAMMVSSQLNIHDEVDASKPEVIDQYETRLQAQAGGMRWYFSHPSATDQGVDKFWKISDQKHWFITCPHCELEQYLSWPTSIDPQRMAYVCKECKQILSDDDRRHGKWHAKYPGRQFSGYWVSQLMCPWISAKKILEDFESKPTEYFYNYTLGLPYEGGDTKLSQMQLLQNLTHTILYPEESERVVIGVDTGLRLDYVAGNQKQGLFLHGDTDNYKDLDVLMRRWPKAVVGIDAGGDMIGAQEFLERWRGRVFKLFLEGDKHNAEIVKWDKDGPIGHVQRNSMIQLVVDEFRTRRIPLQGTENDWYEYYLDWANLHRIKVYDDKGIEGTNQFKGIKWVRNGRDHRALATVFWRAMMMRFGAGQAAFIGGDPLINAQKGYESSVFL